MDNNECSILSDDLYLKLSNNNIDILYDERKVSIGKKLSDNDLIGCPFQIIIGSRDLKKNVVEIKERKTGNILKLSPEETINFIINQFNVQRS